MKSFQNFINLTEKTVASAGKLKDVIDPQQQDIEDFKRETSRHRPRPSKGSRSVTTYKTPEKGVSWEVSKSWEKKVPSTPEELLQKVELSAEKKKQVNQIKQSVFKKPKKIKKISNGKNLPTPEVSKTPEVKPPATKPATAKIELPKSTRTVAQKAKPGLYKIPTSRQLSSPKTTELPKVSAPKTVSKPAFSKPPVVKAPKPSVGSIVKDALKSERKARAAEKAAQSASRAAAATKFLGNVGKTAGIIGAGIEAKQAYDVARREGASRKRSIGAGAARALGGLAGGALGGAAGSVLGIPGQVGGAVAGYQAGTELGTKAYRALTGDPGKKLTTQGLLSNIRKTVPYSVRSSVPEPARKTFKSFVTQAGKTYSQLQKNIKK